MPLTFGDNTARDKWNRCKQDAALLEEEVTTERFVRFAENAWHLRDWIEADPTVPPSAKSEVSPWKQKRPIPELSVCQDIANANKHLAITRYTPSAAEAAAEQGWGVGRYGKGGYGIGEQQITITMADGTRFDALAVMRAVTAFWDDFFTRHAL